METPAVTPHPNAGPNASLLRTRPIHLILDFDGTITLTDTTAILATVAGEFLAQTEMDKLAHNKRWESCRERYLWQMANDPHIVAMRERRTISEEIRYLRCLRPVDEASVSRVGQSGIFKGVPETFWRQAASQQCGKGTVQVTLGFLALIGLVSGRGGQWGVVSVNWCQEFVRGVLAYALSDGEVDAIPVLSNHIDEETGLIIGPRCGPAPLTGPFTKNYRISNDGKLIISSLEKVDAMKSIRDSFSGSLDDGFNAPMAESHNETLPPLVLYVGDSMTDLECLMEADIGIVMSPLGTNVVVETLRLYGIRVMHIAFWEPQPQKSIWFATNFYDIINCKLFYDSRCLPQRSRNREEIWP